MFSSGGPNIRSRKNASTNIFVAGNLTLRSIDQCTRSQTTHIRAHWQIKMRTDQYYATCFPFLLMEQFMEPPLNYERPYDSYARGRRELAFGFTKQQQGVADPLMPSIIKVQAASEGLLRYQSFGAQDGKTFAQRLRERMNENKNTTRIDVGPVYALTPEEARKRSCGVEFRELIFDIDIFPDYNPFRRCRCVEAEKGQPPFVCTECWPFLSAAVHTLDYFLQAHLGFHECMWLFSGRRGVHCWVLDPAAGTLNEVTRRSIASFIKELSKLGGIPPSMRIARQACIEHIYSQILLPRFEVMIAANRINISNTETMAVIANAVQTPVSSGREFLRVMAHLERNPEYSASAWTQLKKILADAGHPPLVDLVFYVLFPKIDYNVVPSLKHLLRCPMSVHTGSMGVVVPLLVSEMDSINPAMLPNLRVPHSMNNFAQWANRFQGYLWSRHPLANRLVCLRCANKLPSLLKLTDQMVFDTEPAELREHMHRAHGMDLESTKQLDLQQHTLRELIHQRTAQRGTGLTDWTRKYDVFTKLCSQL